MALGTASLTGQTCEGVFTFVKGASAVGDADSSGGEIVQIGVVEVMFDVVDGATEGAVGGGAFAIDAGRRALETLGAVWTDVEADGTGFEANGGAELHDGAAIGTGGAVVSAFEEVK